MERNCKYCNDKFKCYMSEYDRMNVALLGIPDDDSCNECSKNNRLVCKYCKEEFDTLDLLKEHYDNYNKIEFNTLNNGCCFYCNEYLFWDIQNTCQLLNQSSNKSLILLKSELNSYICDKCNNK